MKPRLL